MCRIAQKKQCTLPFIFISHVLLYLLKGYFSVDRSERVILEVEMRGLGHIGQPLPLQLLQVVCGVPRNRCKGVCAVLQWSVAAIVEVVFEEKKNGGNKTDE